MVPKFAARPRYVALLYAAAFGAVVYGVYDFTAAAVLKDWDMRLALLDVLWGAAVYAAAPFLASLMLR